MRRARGSPPEVPVPDAQGAAGEDRGSTPLPPELPVLPVRGMVVFPSVVVPLLVVDEGARKLTDEALAGGGLLAVATVRPGATGAATSETLHPVGTAVRPVRAIDLPNGKLNLIVEGLSRVELHGWSGRPAADLEGDALILSARRPLQRYQEVLEAPLGEGERPALTPAEVRRGRRTPPTARGSTTSP